MIDVFGMCAVYRDEAEMDYLKIAQDLDMYGVSYFAITVSHSFSQTLLSYFGCVPIIPLFS